MIHKLSSEMMSRLILLVLIFILWLPINSYCSTHKNVIPCPEIERQALLSFKRSLNDTRDTLSSWNTSNCCSWEGVSCSNSTGRVDGLDLPDSGLQGPVNPSLLNLTRLKHLDLSMNHFQETMPSFIGSLASLEYLNLSYAGFLGMVPHTIGNLSNINSLSLGGYNRALVDPFYWPESMFVDSLEWLSGLSQLEQINMYGVNLRRATNWVDVISRLPSLVELRLPSCSLDYIAPVNDINTTSLSILDLSSTNFHSPIPRWIFQQINLIYLDLIGASFDGPISAIANFTKLQHLDLSYNSLNYSIPDWLYSCKDLEFVSLADNFLENTISDAVGNLTSLTTLDLSNNELTGKIPRGIGNLCKLQQLDLRGNMLEGEISYSFGNMSDCFLGTLTYIDLFGNQLSGHLTHQFGEFRSLQKLDLTGNKISGEIPANLGNLSSLKFLWLNDNKFTGNLPMSIGQLSNLESLDVSNNMLEGVVSEIHFANFTKLMYLLASENKLMTLKVSPDWIPPFYLTTLLLGSWNLGAGSAIPSWLHTQKDTLEYLDLSSTGISGNVPAWFWELNFLNLSHNHLFGKIPDINAPMGTLYLNSNNFSGSLPRVGYTMVEINLSDNLFSGGMTHLICSMTHEIVIGGVIHETIVRGVINLGGNRLTGEIPDCWMKVPFLEALNLGNNNFTGTIPNSLGLLNDLLSLNLYGNQLSGQIPVSIVNCSNLVKMDLSSNYLVGNIPTWIGENLPELRFLILGSNKFNGIIPSSICHLNRLQILDFSNNMISGIIPACVDNFTAMATRRFMSKGGLDISSGLLKVSYFEFASATTKGNKYEYTTILSLITNIDLSNNNLSGKIPKELTSLVELRSLNLSGNNLCGLIPRSIGDMKQIESLDFSRNSLFGEIPNGFTNMSSLSYLNLSCNHLTGKIPESTQLLGMNASSFMGNNLCGPPLPTNCSHDDGAHEPLHKKDDKGEIEWFYVILSLGYAVGFSVFCTTLILKKAWRISYFGFIERMWDKFYVYFHIKLAKLTSRE